MQWFDESLIDTDAKAFGVYLTLLACKGKTYGWYGDIPEWLLRDIKNELAKALSGKELAEAFRASERFLTLLHEHEKEKLKKDKSVLDIIEEENYEKLKMSATNIIDQSKRKLKRM